MQNVCRPLLLVVSLACLACSHPTTASGGPPKQAGAPTRGCRGDAPVDKEIAQVYGVRASWFNDPDGSKRLYVLEAGRSSHNQPTLVLIHGVGEVGTGDFHPVLASLARSRHVLAVDLPGFGRSGMEGEDFGPEKLVHSVDVVSRACASTKLDVLGHSSGGALALLFAAHRSQDVRRLVIVDAAGILRPEVLLRGQLHQTLTNMRERAPVAGKVVEKVGDVLIEAMHRLTPRASDVADSGLLGRSPPVLAATRLLDFNFGEAIRDIHAPTLILWGKEDHVVPPRIAHLLDDRIAHSELEFIDGAGHVPMKDQPELFASLVSGYLNSPIERKQQHPSPNSSTREGRCDGQENIILEGDYARIEVNGCKKIWLNRVRARQIVVKESEGRLDNAEVSEGVTIEKSEMSLTGGSLRGAVALTLSDSKLDIAGVDLAGESAALSVREKSEVVFSVTPLKSPKNDRIFHGAAEYEAGTQL